MSNEYIFEATPEEEARITKKNGRPVLTWRKGSIHNSISFPETAQIRLEIIKPL